jgi:hypothetical protein
MAPSSFDACDCKLTELRATEKLSALEVSETQESVTSQ